MQMGMNWSRFESTCRRKFFIFHVAINWITGKSGEHEEHNHRSGIEAALEAEVAASEPSSQLPNQPPQRKYSTYLKTQQAKIQKGTR